MSTIATSKTHRLYLLLKEQIAGGEWNSDDRLPSEPQLAKLYNVSRVTVRRALDGLARDGLIRKSVGAGTFVTKVQARERVTADLTDMLAHLAEMGRSSRVRLLAFSYGEPPQVVAEALRLASGQRTQHAVRVRISGDTPFSHLTTYVPEMIGATYSKRDLAKTPLLTLLERSGVVAHRAEQTIAATLAGPETAAALGVEIGAPLLALTRVVYDQRGQGIEYLSALYRPDMHSIRMELLRAGRGSDRYWLQTRPSSPTPSPRKLKSSSQHRRRRAA